MVFNDLYNINLAYRQCQLANEYANDDACEIIGILL